MAHKSLNWALTIAFLIVMLSISMSLGAAMGWNMQNFATQSFYIKDRK